MSIKIFQRNNFREIEYIVDEIFNNEVVLLVINTIEFKTKFYTEEFLKIKEIKHAQNFKSDTARINYIVARSVVNKIFSRFLNKDVEKIEVTTNEYKKSYVINAKGIKFNISHTAGLVIVGFSLNEIGVDIEWIDEKFDYRDILDNCFTVLEIKYIANDLYKFYELWTIKEAYLKCEGIGLIRDPKEIELVSISEKKAILSDNKGYYRELEIIRNITGYIGAISIMEELWIY